MARFDTGLPSQDAQDDFDRQRRQRALARLGNRLRGEPSDFNVILPFEEVVEALGYVGETYVGLTDVELDSIIGTVGRGGEFDRRFRPTSKRTRARWQRMAEAQRRGAAFPPISVYRIGGLHFVRDGHHRVSVARALGATHIEAYVTEVRTKVGADGTIRLADLPMKGHERLFRERVPLPPGDHDRIRVSDPWAYAELAEGVEAWGFRAMQDRRQLMSREEVARMWFDEEYLPVVRVLRESGFIGDETEADAYMRVVSERYRLLRTHAWSDEVWERLKSGLG